MLLESGVSEVGQGYKVMRETEARWAVFWGSGGRTEGLGDSIVGQAAGVGQWERGGKEHRGSEPSGP